MNPDELQAGRELDALIAEKVMGCIVYRDREEPYCGCGKNKHSRYYHSDCQISLAEYSTDIAAAFEVVEKIQKTHFIQLAKHTDWIWHFDIMDKTKGEAFTGEGETAPLAICRAALKVVQQ